MSRRGATDPIAESPRLRGELVATAASYRHTHAEHRRARPGGHTHRHLEARLEELSAHFERLLANSVLDETVSAEWRRHVYHSGPEPDTPAAESLASASHRPPRNRERGSGPLWQR